MPERESHSSTPGSESAAKPPGVVPKATARVGVLALQGDFAAHARALPGIPVVEVRIPAQLDGLGGLILPGGESTTLLRLMRMNGLDDAVRRFHARGGDLFGTCAGLILLAREVLQPRQESLGILDTKVHRNAWGRQIDSFVEIGDLHLDGGAPQSMEMVFIRAPRVLEVGPGVRVLGRLRHEPVLLEQPPTGEAGRILAATFHPEMVGWNPVHSHFLRNLPAGSLHRTLEADAPDRLLVPEALQGESA